MRYYLSRGVALFIFSDTYMDYLQLPKFKSLKSDLTDLMFTLFRTVWEEYVEFGKRQKVNSIKKEID